MEEIMILFGKASFRHVLILEDIKILKDVFVLYKLLDVYRYRFLDGVAFLYWNDFACKCVEFYYMVKIGQQRVGWKEILSIPSDHYYCFGRFIAQSSDELISANILKIVKLYLNFGPYNRIYFSCNWIIFHHTIEMLFRIQLTL